MLALPALIAVGLLAHTEKYFHLPKGFYRLDTIFFLLAFLSLARLKSMEELRSCPPGELCRDWMAEAPEAAGILYVDGHTRVYHGRQTELPRHYVSRQQLCLRATVDYWINAMDGQPFFVVNQAIDPGLLQVLEEEIVPRLERDLPPWPFPSEPGQLPWRHRFVLVFDREGYSPAFVKRMRERGIACLTYNKFPGNDWPLAEFRPHTVTLRAGNVVEMQLAERGVFLGQELWVRELRKLSESCHQTSIISTNYINDCGTVAAAMFARWSQENFFKYMRQNFNLDRLADYSTEEISGSTKIVNPQYRELDGEIRRGVGQLNRKHKEFGALQLSEELGAKQVEAYELKKAKLREESVVEQKICRKATPKHVTLADLPKEEQFRRLGTQSKYFIDTIKMIAYRAETAMTGIVREKMSRPDEARSLLRAIYASTADIVPDEMAKTLTVRLHQLANRCSGEVAEHLCQELNSTRTLYPGTDLRLIYELVS